MIDLLKLSAYDYELPKNKIAQQPHNPADECKMLYCKVKGNRLEMEDLIFKDILNLLSENDVLFFNNSKVVKARIWGQKSNQKRSEEGKYDKDDVFFYFENEKWDKIECKNCEILFLKKVDFKLSDVKSGNVFEALVRPWKKFKIWRKIFVKKWEEFFVFKVIDFTKEGRLIAYLGDEDLFEILDKLWKMPLPPYVEYKKEKEKSYQPVFAEKSWSVAAPTASLHFTKELLDSLEKKWVQKLYSTLHIWLGTFKTVDVENIQDYNIHSETVQIPIDIFKNIWKLKKEWKNLIAVWTTATRIIESLPYLYYEVRRVEKRSEELRRGQERQVADLGYVFDEYFEELVKNIELEEVKKFISWEIQISNWIISFETKLYIYPWFKYKLVDKLVTNFHLPKSSLLMLVAAFMWYENMMKAYEHAIGSDYKFFSFWDAMFIERTENWELRS